MLREIGEVGRSFQSRGLRAEAVADVEDVDAAREIRSDLGHESPHGRGRLGQVGSVPRPQAQVQPPLVEREREPRADAVVDGRGGVPPLPQEPTDVSEVVHREARHAPRLPRLTGFPDGREASAVARQLDPTRVAALHAREERTFLERHPRSRELHERA